MLQKLQSSRCQCNRVQEADLQLRTRVHPSHDLLQRIDWLACQSCKKSTKIIDGKVQGWVAGHWVCAH